MARIILYFADAALIAAATLVALFLRENFEPTAVTFGLFLPYFAASFAAALLVLPLVGLNRPMWRFSCLQDHLRLAGAVALTVAAACGFAFAYNRLDGIARSLPFLQLLTGIALLIGARVAHKLVHEARHRRKLAAKLLSPVPLENGVKTVLIVGLSRLAEAYLQAVADFAPGKLRIAGFAGGGERHRARMLAGHPVLGSADDLESILESLDVHGVSVNCIVVAAAFASLSGKAREALIAAERLRGLELRFLAEDMGLCFETSGAGHGGTGSRAGPGFAGA